MSPQLVDLSTERYLEAEAHLRKALEADPPPQDPEIYMKLGDACFGAAKYNDALQQYDRCLGLAHQSLSQFGAQVGAAEPERPPLQCPPICCLGLCFPPAQRLLATCQSPYDEDSVDDIKVLMAKVLAKMDKNDVGLELVTRVLRRNEQHKNGAILYCQPLL